MPWMKDSKSDKTASEEIFGMKAEDVVAQLKAGSEAKAKLEALETSVGTGFTEIKDALAKLQVTPSNNQGNNQNQNQGNNSNGNEGETKVDWFADPEAAFAHNINKVMKPLVDVTLQTRSDMVFDKVKNSFSDFKLFEDEIRKEIDTAPGSLRANESYIRNAYHMVKGRHADDIAADRAKGSGKYFIESANSNTNNVPNTNKEKVVLTTEEKDYASKFGLTDEQYIESRKGMRYV